VEAVQRVEVRDCEAGGFEVEGLVCHFEDSEGW
jgi:hypothetical protein